MGHAQTMDLFYSLRSGDRVEVEHVVKVGFRSWNTRAVGTVVGTERQRHSLHYNRNFDDKVFSDTILLKRDDGELTTFTLDEFSTLRKLASPDQTDDHESRTS